MRLSPDPDPPRLGQGSTLSLTPIRVRYADTDAQGVVYHGVFFTFFEVARLDLLSQLLGSEPDATALWNSLVIASACCDYGAPVRYPEIVTVKAGISNVGTTSFKILYEVSNFEGAVVARGATVQVHVGPEKRPAPITLELRSLLASEHNHSSPTE
jgi:acyl-CoA thioester hydrolase